MTTNNVIGFVNENHHLLLCLVFVTRKRVKIQQTPPTCSSTVSWCYLCSYLLLCVLGLVTSVVICLPSVSAVSLLLFRLCACFGHVPQRTFFPCVVFILQFGSFFTHGDLGYQYSLSNTLASYRFLVWSIWYIVCWSIINILLTYYFYMKSFVPLLVSACVVCLFCFPTPN